MEDTFVRDALHSHVETDEPPLGLTSAGLVKAGRRSRYVRAAVGSGLALALVGGGLAATLALRPAPEPTWPPTGVVDCAVAGTVVRPDASPWPPLRTWYSTELTCYLKDTVPGLLAPEASITGARPLEAVRGNDPVFAAAVVSDTAGTGRLVFGIGRTDDLTTVQNVRECTADEACSLRNGPDQEEILIRESTGPDGVVGYTVTVYADDVYAFATATNAVSGDLPSEGPPTRDRPPLTTEQLMTIALATSHLGGA